LIPDGTDILVLHGPPLGYGDAAYRGPGRPPQRTGCAHLLRRIEEVRPRLVVYGHIHEDRGRWRLGETILANVAIQNVEGGPQDGAVVFDLERGR
jgi:Icc-related predicted phosphoesterase